VVCIFLLYLSLRAAGRPPLVLVIMVAGEVEVRERQALARLSKNLSSASGQSMLLTPAKAESAEGEDD
jgi:hypothetical protein